MPLGQNVITEPCIMVVQASRGILYGMTNANELNRIVQQVHIIQQGIEHWSQTGPRLKHGYAIC